MAAPQRIDTFPDQHEGIDARRAAAQMTSATRNRLPRVLHVVPYFPPDRIGGVGEVAAHLHSHLVASGHDSHVLTTGTSRSEAGITRVAESPDFFGLAALRHIGLAREFDVIHAHQGEALPLLAALSARGPKPPVLVTFHVNNRLIGASNAPFVAGDRRYGIDHASRLQRMVKSPAKHALDRVALRLATRTSYIAQSAAREVSGSEVAQTIIYNALPRLAPQPRQASAVEPAEILFVGAPGTRKRTALLPHILREVRRDFPMAKLRIVGFWAQDQPELDRDIKAFDLVDAVIFEGPKLSSELNPYYAAAKTLVVPSAYEGLPMVILEGFQHGLPCVATNVGGHAEVIVDEQTGFLAERDDVVGIVHGITRILANPTLATAMGENARSVVADRFDLDAQVKRYMSLYQELASSGSST